MFSPSLNQNPAGPPPGSIRSSRRRQRPLSNEGSIVQPKAKRQRSALSGETFLPPNGAPAMEEAKTQAIAKLPSRGESSREPRAPGRPMAVRGKKPSKGDGSLILVCLFLLKCHGPELY
jgi:nuclear pore complex protein Nup133